MKQKWVVHAQKLWGLNLFRPVDVYVGIHTEVYVEFAPEVAGRFFTGNLYLTPTGMNSDDRKWKLGPLKTKICKNLGGVRAGPRSRDELGPTKANICRKSDNLQKFVRGPTCPREMGWTRTIENEHLQRFRGVRSGPRRWDELGPPKTKFCKNLGGVRAGPRSRDELGPTKAKICKKKQKFEKNCEGSELVPGDGMN